MDKLSFLSYICLQLAYENVIFSVVTTDLFHFKVMNIQMTGAIDYVQILRHDIQSCRFQFGGTFGLSTVASNMEKTEFLSSFIHAFC